MLPPPNAKPYYHIYYHPPESGAQSSPTFSSATLSQAPIVILLGELPAFPGPEVRGPYTASAAAS